MKTNYLLFFIFLISKQFANAQHKTPTIKATSTVVSIRDGEIFKDSYWTITPYMKPDIYVTNHKRITFYTDRDSISINVNSKKKKFDFNILLNEKDTAWTQVQYEIGYLTKLKKAKKYNLDDNRFVPKFEYQSMNDSNLIKIRRDLNIDSIAGTGNEISKILNLMHWVHNTITHDGASNNPTEKNAIDLIKICKTENRGINCRMMATVLNECYLAIGIRSRYLTCMPKETEFEECHVINMVYSNDYKKWIWIDPTFDAYIMNEKGELLGPEEVRSRLINNKTLIVNPDANWNKKTSQTKEGYLENYMAKNLYRFQTPLISEYNTETWQKGKSITYIELLPLDGIEQMPQKNIKLDNKKNIIITNYKTNNPLLFWAKP